MKQVKLLFIITLLCSIMSNLWAQTVNLATWTFTNAASDWGPSPRSATLTNADVTIGGLTRGSGVSTTGTAAGTAWGGSGFNDAVVTQTALTAIAQGNFVTFTVTANAGFTLSMTNIAAYNIRRSGTGPAFMLWQYSINGTDFTDIGTTITIGTVTSNVGNPKPAVTLSGITELQNLPSGTTVTLRAVMWGSSNDSGTWYFNSANAANPSLLINGVVSSTPLSLSLVSFKGKTESNGNNLDWITADEKDVARFEIERGTDGRNFNKIAVIKATGNDKETENHYSYDDIEAVTTAYYRLKMIDRNSTAHYSDVVLLHNENSKTTIHIYPNPVSGVLYLEGLNKASSYSITDVSGRNVGQGTVRDAAHIATSVDVAGLVSGVYFLQISDGKGRHTIRFIKK